MSGSASDSVEFQNENYCRYRLNKLDILNSNDYFEAPCILFFVFTTCLNLSHTGCIHL